MINIFVSSAVRHRFRKNSLIIGSLFLISGLISIFVPAVTSFALSYLLGVLFIFGSVISAFHVAQSYNRKWVAWFKPIVLFIIGAVIFAEPLTGVAAMGLLLMIYFFFDGFAGIFLGLEFRPITGWFWMVLDGAISFLIGLIFLFGWPISAIWLIGLLVGISLVADGVALILLGMALPKYEGFPAEI